MDLGVFNDTKKPGASDIKLDLGDVDLHHTGARVVDALNDLLHAPDRFIL
jgi:hypothetical protein